MTVLRFPDRHRSAVFIVPESLGGFYVIARAHGWLFSSFREAHAEAQAIAEGLGLPVRVEVAR